MAFEICSKENCNNKSLKGRSSKGLVFHMKYCQKHWGDLSRKKIPKERIIDELRYLNNQGYVMFIDPNTEIAVLEHRYLMEKKMGRKLKNGENVHHKNGLRADNSPSNLELWISPQPGGLRAKDLKCPHCKKTYI